MSKWQALIGLTEYTFELEKESTGTLPFASPHISFELFLVSFKVCSATDISVDAYESTLRSFRCLLLMSSYPVLQEMRSFAFWEL
jgi:hypothetical protein